MSVQQLTEDWFELETLRAAIAACGVQDNRQGPISGGTGFVLLHHLVGAAEGSMRRAPWRAGSATFASIAENTARQHGVTIRTGADVASISVRDDVVTGVVLRNGEELHAQRVLSSLDPARTLLGLVDPVWLDPEVLLALRNIRYRGCTAYVLFALDELPAVPGLARADDVLRGTLSCSPDVMSLERAADAGKYGRMPDMPHVEITAPSLHWPDLAPAGKHVVLARAQYASYRLRGGATWDAVRSDALADSVTALIDAVIPCFSARVLQRTTLTPRDLEERFGLTEGAITHGELALDQILFMRPIAGFGQYAMPIDGLYLCGAGTHPGPGVTGGPGWLAAQRVLADSRK
jgi:phytoene dehydrogenase-like protein